MAVEIQLRRDTAANWTSENPTLAEGEPGYETDTGKIKYGDGTTAWVDLPYADGGGGGGQFSVADFLFTEPGGAHADLTATLDIADGVTVLDVWVYILAGPCADAGAALDVGTAGTSYFSAVGVGNGTNFDGAYGAGIQPDPGTSGANFFSLYSEGADFFGNPPWKGSLAGQFPGGGVLYTGTDTITMTVSGIDTGGGGASLLVRVLYLPPVTPTPAT